ncbi:hypothetical protein BV898_04122 [Hypsibius exemplaris]|uniref:Uncharacterized protein n=1 Tax=Hypsibius exemplaris TaxID=2072580 RepID=A0A1W0X339_HYPEX|nr:hypothetical protein BV898_04122 [Hypsibius exemplaris]
MSRNSDWKFQRDLADGREEDFPDQEWDMDWISEDEDFPVRFSRHHRGSGHACAVSHENSTENAVRTADVVCSDQQNLRHALSWTLGRDLPPFADF